MSPCQNCHAGCCRSFAVSITGADIIRIERDLKLNFWDFVCRWEDREGLITRGQAPQFFFDDEPSVPFAICLMHSQSQFFQKSTKCRFLMEGAPDRDYPLGQARCGIYGSRPSACRIFPTRLSSSGQIAEIYDIPSHGRHEQLPIYELCPRPWIPADLDPVQTVEDLVIARFEQLFFQQLARVWNKSPQSWASFPDFIRFVYEKRLIRKTASEMEAEIPATIPFFRAA